MSKVTIVLGKITFEETATAKANKAIIHEVEDVLHVEEKYANEVADNLIDPRYGIYDSYVIPSLYEGEIEWKNPREKLEHAPEYTGNR